MKFFQRLSAVLLLFFLTVAVIIPPSVNAATFRSGENITITEPLKDLYVSGGTVDITSPITNDLVAAGGTIRVDGDVTNSLIVAGGTVTLSGNVGNTVRAAGGTLNVQNVIGNDLVIAGGTIEIDDEARIDGDLVVTGGTVRINGPVRGNIWLTGGDITLNSTVGGNVWGGDVTNLRIGQDAVINGDLNYRSEKRAQITNGAVIRGEQNFTQAEHKDRDGKGDVAGLLTAGTLYKLITDILVTLFFIWLLPRFFRRTSETIAGEPLITGITGFGTLTLMPIVSLMLLVFLWLGIASFLLYALLLLLSVIVVNAFVGWFVLRWWYGRDDKKYVLDWKAAVVGPIILTILWLIPVIGWLIIFILWLMGIGALVLQLWNFVTYNRNNRITERNDARVIESRPAATPARTTTSRPSRSTAKRKR